MEKHKNVLMMINMVHQNVRSRGAAPEAVAAIVAARGHAVHGIPPVLLHFFARHLCVQVRDLARTLLLHAILPAVALHVEQVLQKRSRV